MIRQHFKQTLPIMILASCLATLSCDRSFTPKPAGYVKIETPEKDYRIYDLQPFYRFEIPVYAEIVDNNLAGATGWINLVVPMVNGTIYLSYKPVEGNLGDYITDCRTLAYKHTVKADGIEETPFVDRTKKRFGMIYDLSGDVASAVQFFITDSTTHFLRGSLYFNALPNRDSLKPVIDFMREDILHLIQTTEWKY
jgi:gliding motility-associated lipoprotein GldD